MSDVKFQLDYETDDGGVREMSISLKALDGGTLKLARDMEKLEGSTRKAVKAQRDMAKAGTAGFLGDIKGKLSAIKDMQAFQVVSQGIGMAVSAFGAVTSAAAGFLDTLAGAERDNVAMAHVLGADDAASIGKFLDIISDKTEFTENQLGGFALELGRIGLAGKDLALGLAAGLDLSALSGKGLEGMQAYVNSMRMISKTGMVGGEIFEMLGGGAGGETGKVDFFNELSARTGKSVEKLKKDLAAGKVAVSDSLGAITALITKRTGKDIGAIGLEQGAGLGAKLTQLKNLPERFIQDLAGGDMSGKLTASFDKILTMFAPGSPFGKAIGGGLAKVVELGVMAIEMLPPALERASVAVAPLMKVGEELWGVIKALYVVLQPLSAGLGAQFVGILKLAAFGLRLVADTITYLTPLLLPITEMVGSIQLALGALSGYIPTAMASLDAFATSLWSSFTGFFERFYNFGSEIVSGLVKGIGDSIGEAVKTVENLGGQVVGTLKSMLGIASPSKVFAEFGRMTGLGFTGGLEGEAPRISASVSKTFDVSAPSVNVPTVSATVSAGASISLGETHIHINEPGASASDIAATVTQTLMAKLQSLADGFSSEVPA